VLLIVDTLAPIEPVPARIGGASDDRAWADSYRPGWVGWLVLVVLFTAVGVVVRSLSSLLSATG
jgi:hypothetical protein